MTVKTRLVAVLAIVLFLVAACSSGGSTASPAASAASVAPSAATSLAPSASASAAASASAPAGTTNLTVLAAASLKAVMAKATSAYTAANPGVTFTVSTDASSALATQITQGAPADVFLSADTTNPKKLSDGGLTAGPPQDFAGNLLAVIVPASNPADIQTPADLAKAGVKIIAAGDAVPITKYATQLVANLAKQPGYPADFVAKYNANIVSKEDNVSAVVAKIATGNGDAAICYVTDAKTAGDKVKTNPPTVPTDANVPATYAGVVIKASSHLDASNAFLTWLIGPDGQAILASFGFLPPPAS